MAVLLVRIYGSIFLPDDSFLLAQPLPKFLDVALHHLKRLEIDGMIEIEVDPPFEPPRVGILRKLKRRIGRIEKVEHLFFSNLIFHELLPPAIQLCKNPVSLNLGV